MARTTFKGPVRSLSGFISTGDVMGQALSAGTVDGGTDITGIDLYKGRCMTIGNTTTVFNLPEIVSDSAVNPSTLSTIGLEYTFLLTANLSGETFTLNAGTAAIESSLAGTPTLLLDREGCVNSYLYKLPKKKVIFKDF